MTITTTVTHQEMLNVITALWFTLGRSGYNTSEGEVTYGLPFFVLDEPGTGKTTILRELAYSLGFDHVEEVTMTQRSAEDIGGYGIPNRARDAIVKVPEECIKRVNDCERGLLVLDEFGSVEDDKRAACLRVTSERSAGDVRIGGHIRMIAVGNPESSAANANPLDAASANRYIHVPWIAPDEEGFCDWLTTGASRGTHASRRDGAAIEAQIREGWQAAFGQAAGVVSAYVLAFKGDLHRTPLGQGEDPQKGEADQLRWPSRRIWEMVTRALAGGSILGLTKVETDFLIGCCLPKGVSKKLVTFLKDNDVPRATDVLDGKVEFKPTARMDRTQVVLRSTAAVLVSQRNAEYDGDHPDRISKDLRARAVRWWGLCEMIKDGPVSWGGRDFIVPTASIISRSLKRDGAALNKDIIPEASPVVADIYEILMARRRAEGSR